MTEYLFEDIFNKYKLFFKTDKMRNSTFLYDISFGFMPRYFEPEEFIYVVDDEVAEMYFGLCGKVGVGYNLINNQ